MDTDLAIGLVPGRECGNCTECCKVMTIDSPELRKPPGVYCPHCLPGTGCGIYERRPSLCRTWHCQWRRSAWIDASLRPDRSGVLAHLIDTKDLEGYAGNYGFVFEVLGPCDVLINPKVTEAIGAVIDRGIAAFVAVPALPGYIGGRALLNPVMSQAVADRDFGAACRLLIEAYISAALHPRKTIILGPAAPPL